VQQASSPTPWQERFRVPDSSFTLPITNG
jgi:hypothetical protein